MDHQKRQDLVVSGAGLVGSLLSCLCADKGLGVCVVDPGLLRPSLEDGSPLVDGRSFAIAYGSAEVLKAAGIWKHLRDIPGLLKTIVVSHTGGKKTLCYHAEDVGVEALGYLVPASDLKQALRQALLEREDRLTFRMPGQVVSWEASEDKTAVTLGSGEILMTSLLVGAEGRNSLIAEKLSPQTWGHTYDQTALVFTLGHTEDHQNRAYEHFTPEGPLALLPLEGRQMGVVWSLKTQVANQLVEAPEVLLNALIQHFGWGLGTLTLLSQIQAYPLSLRMPRTSWGERVVLVGDGAHVLHPVAGQGLNVGFRDVVSLAEALSDARSLGLDPGSPSILGPWGKKRRPDQWGLAALTHGLVGLFEWLPPAFRPIIDAGLWGVGASHSFKKRLIYRAMGLERPDGRREE